jgi:hypothetical protein
VLLELGPLLLEPLESAALLGLPVVLLLAEPPSPFDPPLEEELVTEDEALLVVAPPETFDVATELPGVLRPAS